MLSTKTAILFIFTLITPIFAAKPCGTSSSAIYVDIHRREVNGTSEFIYGSFIGLGIPHQNQSLWPSIINNETYFAADTFCDGVALELNCNANTTGGTIKLSSDTTFKEVDNYKTTDTVNTTGALHGTDTIHLYEHFFQSDGAWEREVPEMPVTILQSGNFDEVFTDPEHFGGTVGLGPNSTLLNALVNNNTIPSKSFSLYLGTGFDRAGGDINGSISLGGYDSSMFSGNLTSYTIDSSLQQVTGNPFGVGISKITLNIAGPSPSTVELFEPNIGITALLSTEQYPITLPSAALQKFISATGTVTGTTTSPDGSLVLPPSLSASMTITLEYGNSVTFPAEWLSNISNLSPISSHPATDSVYIYNPNGNHTSILNTNSTASFPILGSAFLSYMYLMVDYTSSEFYLAPAVLDAPFITLTPWCSGTEPKAFTNPKISSFAKAGLPGVLTGGILGGLAISMVALFGTRYVLKKEREEKKVRFMEDVKDGGAGEWDEGDEEGGRSPVVPIGQAFGGVGAVKMMTFDPPPKVATNVSVIELGEGMGQGSSGKKKSWRKGGR